MTLQQLIDELSLVAATHGSHEVSLLTYTQGFSGVQEHLKSCDSVWLDKANKRVVLAEDTSNGS